tara:strand:- start:735 stop:1199 length:465 start_codon:yes stop_codon:yes gene_type:complete
MEFIQLREGLNPKSNTKLQKKIDYFHKILDSLKAHNIPNSSVEFINHQLKEINEQQLDDKKLLQFMRKAQVKIFQHLEKELKLVRKGHYTMMWMPLGLGVFGVPLGIAFGFAISNLALLGIGLPIGMGIGIALGAGMDSKAAQKGQQLDLAIEN